MERTRREKLKLSDTVSVPDKLVCHNRNKEQFRTLVFESEKTNSVENKKIEKKLRKVKNNPNQTKKLYQNKKERSKHIRKNMSGFECLKNPAITGPETRLLYLSSAFRYSIL